MEFFLYKWKDIRGVLRVLGLNVFGFWLEVKGKEEGDDFVFRNLDGYCVMNRDGDVRKRWCFGWGMRDFFWIYIFLGVFDIIM